MALKADPADAACVVSTLVQETDTDDAGDLLPLLGAERRLA